MEIAKEKKRIYDHRFNGFHQIITSSEEVEYTTYTGTMEELVEVSKEKYVYISRNKLTEHLFRAWDEDSKYAEIHNGKVVCFYDRKHEINGAGWYTPLFIVEEKRG